MPRHSNNGRVEPRSGDRAGSRQDLRRELALVHETTAVHGDSVLQRRGRIVIAAGGRVNESAETCPMRNMITTFTLATFCGAWPQLASADNDTRDIVYQTDDIVIDKIDIGDGEIRYQWTIETGTGGHNGTLEEAKRAARKALEALRKAKKQA